MRYDDNNSLAAPIAVATCISRVNRSG